MNLAKFLFLNQCEGHNQDASKTTPSYIALMPFQAPSRLLRELIQLAAREPQTSPAELIHTRSKERERILSKGRGSGRKRESPFLCHDPHSARHTDFISRRAFTQARGTGSVSWTGACQKLGRSLASAPTQVKSSLPSSKRNARRVCQVEVGKSAVRPSWGLPATAVATDGGDKFLACLKKVI